MPGSDDVVGRAFGKMGLKVPRAFAVAWHDDSSGFFSRLYMNSFPSLCPPTEIWSILTIKQAEKVAI